MKRKRIDRQIGRSFGPSATVLPAISILAQSDPKARGIKSLLALATALIVCGIWLAATPAKAAFVTTNEMALDDIFSQSSFGSRTIDIRFNPTVIHDDLSLLNINSEPKIDQLFDLDLTPSNVISMFFVDTISVCSGPFNPSIIGCGQLPGNKLVVESDFAAGSRGGALLAHEIGHNLRLGHSGDSDNLMFGTLLGGVELTMTQVSTILGSGLIQFDGAQRFIEITPILIAQAPIPAAGLLFLSGLFGLFWVRRRQRGSATA